MAAEKKHTLSQQVQALSRDFELENGELCMSREKFLKWRNELRAVPANKRAGMAAELIALAIRFEREGGKETSYGAAQLYFFASGLIDDVSGGGARPPAAEKKSSARAWGK